MVYQGNPGRPTIILQRIPILGVGLTEGSTLSKGEPRGNTGNEYVIIDTVVNNGWVMKTFDQRAASVAAMKDYLVSKRTEKDFEVLSRFMDASGWVKVVSDPDSSRILRLVIEPTPPGQVFLAFSRLVIDGINAVIEVVGQSGKVLFSTNRSYEVSQPSADDPSVSNGNRSRSKQETPQDEPHSNGRPKTPLPVADDEPVKIEDGESVAPEGPSIVKSVGEIDSSIGACIGEDKANELAEACAAVGSSK